MASTDVESVQSLGETTGVVMLPVPVASGLVGRALTAMAAGYAASRVVGVDDTPRRECLDDDGAESFRDRFFS